MQQESHGPKGHSWPSACCDIPGLMSCCSCCVALLPSERKKRRIAAAREYRIEARRQLAEDAVSKERRQADLALRAAGLARRRSSTEARTGRRSSAGCGDVTQCLCSRLNWPSCQPLGQHQATCNIVVRSASKSTVCFHLLPPPLPPPLWVTQGHAPPIYFLGQTPVE